jgi:hypothetical protein
VGRQPPALQADADAEVGRDAASGEEPARSEGALEAVRADDVAVGGDRDQLGDAAVAGPGRRPRSRPRRDAPSQSPLQTVVGESEQPERDQR